MRRILQAGSVRQVRRNPMRRQEWQEAISPCRFLYGRALPPPEGGYPVQGQRQSHQICTLCTATSTGRFKSTIDGALWDLFINVIRTFQHCNLEIKAQLISLVIKIKVSRNLIYVWLL